MDEIITIRGVSQNNYYAVIEPELGGWGAHSSGDGIHATYSGIHGVCYLCKRSS